MNDKEAFEKWMKDEDRHDGVFGNNNNFTRDEWIADKAWQAACAYKKEEYSNIMDAMTKTSQNNAKLKAKNAELEKQNEMLAHQLKYAETILTDVQADKFKLRGKLEIAVEALENISGFEIYPGTAARKALAAINED